MTRRFKERDLGPIGPALGEATYQLEAARAFWEGLIYMKALMGYSAKQIAEAAGISEEGVRVIVDKFYRDL